MSGSCRVGLTALCWLAAVSVCRTAHMQAASAAIVEEGQGIWTELKEAGRDEGFLNRLFNTDCYSSAVRKLDADCRRMSEDQRQRLAYDLARCFLSRSGVQSPPRVCPPNSPVSQCTSSLHDKAFNVYTQFFTNIHSVCIFVANQDFLRQAEELTHALHASSASALSSLHDISANLTAQQLTLQSLGTGLDGLHSSQQLLALDLKEGLNRLGQLAVHANTVEAALGSSLRLQATLASHQALALGALEELTMQEETRAQAAQQRWQAASAAAEALEARQSRYETLQSQLASASEALGQRAVALQGSLDALGHAQERSEALLGYIKGSSHSASDLVAYGFAAVALWLAGGLMPYDNQAAARGLALLLLAGCFLTERWLLGALPSMGWSLTPDGKVPITLTLPWPFTILMHRPLLLVNPRWAVRAFCAAVGVGALLRRQGANRRRLRREAAEHQAQILAIDAHLQELAAMQHTILQCLNSMGGTSTHPAVAPALPAGGAGTQYASRQLEIAEQQHLLIKPSQPGSQRRGAKALQHTTPAPAYDDNRPSGRPQDTSVPASGQTSSLAAGHNPVLTISTPPHGTHAPSGAGGVAAKREQTQLESRGVVPQTPRQRHGQADDAEMQDGPGIDMVVQAEHEAAVAAVVSPPVPQKAGRATRKRQASGSVGEEGEPENTRRTGKTRRK